MPTVNQYNKMGVKYAKTQSDFYKNKFDSTRGILYAQLKNIKGKKVLDAGCGNGEDLPFLIGRGAIVFGIDGSGTMIKIARKNNPTIAKNLFVRKFQKTGFPAKTFDLIFSRYALDYAPDMDVAWKEMHRVLKPKGELVALISHPLTHFVSKKIRKYHSREMVKIPIFGGQVVVTKPSHTFSEYFSSFLLNHFEIGYLYESPGPDGIPKKGEEFVSGYMVIKLKKK